MNKMDIAIERRSLATESDYTKMKLHINSIGRKAESDLSFKNQLLNATGMYDKEGNLKKRFQ